MKNKVFTKTIKNQISNLLSKKILLSVITLLGIVVINAQVNNGVVAHYKFTQDLLNSSPIFQGSASMNSHSFTNGYDGYGLTFASGGFGNHQINNFGSVSEFSIAFWYKHNPANTGQKSLLSGSEMNPSNVSDYVFSVELDNSGAGLVVYAYQSGTYINTGSPIDTSSWQHIVATFNATDALRIYINGTLVNNQPATANLQAVVRQLNYTSSLTQYNNPGSIYDEVRLYNRALSATDVSDIYNNNFPCTVEFEDFSFWSAVQNHFPIIDTDDNGYIECAEAEVYTGKLGLSNKNITDLTGINAFKNVRSIFLINNELTYLGIDSCTNLDSLVAPINFITDIDLSNEVKANILYIDAIDNNLTNFDVSNCPELNTLLLNYNALSSLDLSGNHKLGNVECTNNQIQNVTFSQNDSLYRFVANANHINALDISPLPNLSIIELTQNALNSFDISQNPRVFWMYLDNNDLYSLNLANGYNSLLGSYIASYHNFTQNPNLSCIQVDDSLYSANNWTNIDSWSSYSENCGFSTLVSSITVQGQGGVDEITTAGGTLQMEATILPTNATDGSYTWSVANGTGSASIDANGLLTASTNGVVTVTATANDGSGVSGSADITISNQGTAIKDMAFEGLSIYPNPTNDMVNIKVNEALSSIQLFDITGKIVKVFDATNTQLNVSDVQQGIYFLELKNNEKRSVVKLAIE